jgi:hypothetical protein
MVDSFSTLLENLEKLVHQQCLDLHLINLACRYSRMVTEILKAANNVNLDQEVGTRVKWMVNEVFLHLCGDYPGAVAIRDSHVGFERLKEFDEDKESDRLAQPPTSRLGNRISRLMRCLPSTRRDTDTFYLGPEISCPNESDSKRFVP